MAFLCIDGSGTPRGTIAIDSPLLSVLFFLGLTNSGLSRHLRALSLSLLSVSATFFLRLYDYDRLCRCNEEPSLSDVSVDGSEGNRAAMVI